MRIADCSSEDVRPQLSRLLGDNKLSRGKKMKRESVFLVVTENWQVRAQSNRECLELQRVSCQSHREGDKALRHPYKSQCCSRS